MKATSFNAWISENALRLRQSLSITAPFDEDAFQDAYLTLAGENRRQDEGATFERAFVGAYRKATRQAQRETFTTCHPDDLFFTLIPTAEETEATDSEAERMAATLAKTIKSHIQATYSRAEVAIWEMRMLGNSIRDIADTLGLSRTTADRTIQRIAEQTRAQFAYAI